MYMYYAENAPTTPVVEEQLEHDLGVWEPSHLDPRKAKQAERLGMGMGRMR